MQFGNDKNPPIRPKDELAAVIKRNDKKYYYLFYICYKKRSRVAGCGLINRQTAKILEIVNS
jgi:hypothetical protein